MALRIVQKQFQLKIKNESSKNPYPCNMYPIRHNTLVSFLFQNCTKRPNNVRFPANLVQQFEVGLNCI